MIGKIIAWIIKTLMSVYYSSIAREMAMTTLKIAAGEFKDAAVKTLVAVQEANGKDDLTSRQKYNYVVRAVKTEYTEIPKSVLNQLIENALALVKQEG
jgi:hypothetical protein